MISEMVIGTFGVMLLVGIIPVGVKSIIRFSSIFIFKIVASYKYKILHDPILSG
jgi:hypothetical protein